jgi:chaperone modulatory protein CbpM
LTRDERVLEELTVVSLTEVVVSSGLSPQEIDELIELGVLEPRAGRGAEPTFAAHSIDIARFARRLQRDFELPLAGVALVLAYRERLRELEARLRVLESLLQPPGDA